MYDVTCPRPQMLRVFERLWRQSPRPIHLQLGANDRETEHELLVGRERNDSRGAIEIRLVDSFTQNPRTFPPGPHCVLEVGRGNLAGRAQAFYQPASQSWRPLDRLRLVGPGMHVVSLESRRGDNADRREWPLVDPESRTVGALGSANVQRLRALDVAVVGVGRTGVRVIQSLAALGVRRLAIIDRDVFEAHNLNEIDYLSRDAVGLSKVHTMADYLAGAYPQVQVTPVEASITHLRALEAVRACDVIFCCCDHDSARLAATFLSSLFHKVLIDIATEIQHRPRFRMVASVRLIIPGSTAACLLCLGGLPNETQARELLSSADAEEEFYANRNWRTERAGSLASLNTLAAATAIRGLEDLVAERVTDSFWAQAEYDPRGRLTVLYPPASPPRRPCVCRFSGLGTDGLRLVPSFLRGEEL